MALPAAILPALPWVQWGLIIAMLFISEPRLLTPSMLFTGIAWSFIFWVIPIIKLNQSISAILQIEDTSRRGGMWLEPLNASFAALLVLMSVLLSQHPDPDEAAKWKTYAAAGFTLVQVAWWERVLIFPLDDSIAAMKDDTANFTDAACTWLGKRGQGQLRSLMDMWARRHTVRATLPLLAALIALSSKIGRDGATS